VLLFDPLLVGAGVDELLVVMLMVPDCTSAVMSRAGRVMTGVVLADDAVAEQEAMFASPEYEAIKLPLPPGTLAEQDPDPRLDAVRLTVQRGADEAPARPIVTVPVATDGVRLTLKLTMALEGADTTNVILDWAAVTSRDALPEHET
jgi:hypothetical protein